ncbi:hypothetical protein JCM8097_003673 [Rhodosporidiobolus ruineniae]
MDAPESAVLVPDSPAQHEDSSVGQSYLDHLLGREQPPRRSASFAATTYDHPPVELHSQGSGQPDPSAAPLPHRPRRPSSVGDNSRFDLSVADLTTVADSQMPRARSPGAGGAADKDAASRRTSGDTTASFGEPSELLDGDLGETQADPPRGTSSERPRKRSLAGSSRSERSAVPEEEDGEVSMDLTRGSGVTEEDRSLLEAKAFLAKKRRLSQALQPVEEEKCSESQKENPSPSRPASHPTSGLPFSLRNTPVNFDSSGAPSSSPAIARELLQRSPAKKAAEPASQQEPASSADPDISPSMLLPTHLGAEMRNGGEDLPDLPGQTSGSGPITSTPANIAAPPPHPMTASRTLPTFDTQSTDPNPAPPARSAPALGPQPTSNALFATSSAMKQPPAPKPKVQRDAWDGISQSTNEMTQQSSLRSTSAQDSIEMPQTVPHVEDENEDEDMLDQDQDDGGEEEKRLQATPKPTMDRTVDMDIDTTGDGTTINGNGGGFDGSLDNSLASTGVPAFSRAGSSILGDELLGGGSTRRHPSQPPLFAAASSSPSSLSRQNSQVSMKESGRGKRLSDIAAANSSPQPSQFDVPSTQYEYDILSRSEEREVSQKSSEVEVSQRFDTSYRGSFEFEQSNSNSTSKNHSRTLSNPPPGRALRRHPPPPTPAGVGPVFVPPKDSTSSPSLHRPSSTSLPAPDSVPVDATQVDDSFALPNPPAKFFAGDSAQRVPESSPDVPLASTSRAAAQRSSPLKQANSAAQPAEGSSSGEQKRSSGGVVPDSEGPTQHSPEVPAAAAFAAPKPKSRKGKEREEVPAQDFYQDDFGDGYGDGEGGDQEMPDAGGDGEEDVQWSPPKKLSAKAKSKGKASEEVEPVKEKKEKAPSKRKDAPTVKKSTTSTSKGKGKGKQRAASEDEDELDSDPEAAVDAVEETNYSELPTGRNAKKRSPSKKKVVAPPPASKKGKGKKRAEAVSSAEESDDEEVASEKAEESEEEQPARKKRKASSATVDEAEEQEEEPAPRRRASTGKKAAPTKKEKGKGKAVAPAPKEKKVVRTALRARTGSVSSSATAASRTPEPHQPIAGPSRRRLRSVDEDVGDGAVSPANTDAKSTSSASLKQKGALPDSAPFHRVFGLWRDDAQFYPGMIVTYSGGFFHIVFDDNSKGKLRPDELRRCELKRGDLVQYFGNEAETETQQTTLDGDVQVMRVERDGETVDGGELRRDDIVLVASTNDDEGRVERLEVSAIRIRPRHGSQLDDRKLTDKDLASFNAVAPKQPIAPLPLSSPPKAYAVDRIDVNTSSTGLFARTAFIVTSATKQSRTEKEAFPALLESHGATVITWEHLFSVTASKKTTKPPEVFFHRIDFERIDEIFLLADRPSTTPKFLIALALGVPCISKEFAVDSISQNTRLAWEPYALAAGFIHHLGAQALGAQLHAIKKTAFDLGSLEAAAKSGGVFKGRSFLVVSQVKKGKRLNDDKEAHAQQLYVFLSLLSAGGASIVHFVSSPADASSATGYDHVFLADDAASPSSSSADLPTKLVKHKGLVNMTWIKQCLIAGRLLPSARMRDVDEHAK